MQLLMESESGHTRDPYVQMLLEEPEFHGDGTRVVYDALQWALVLGMYVGYITTERYSIIVIADDSFLFCFCCWLL